MEREPPGVGQVNTAVKCGDQTRRGGGNEERDEKKKERHWHCWRAATQDFGKRYKATFTKPVEERWRQWRVEGAALLLLPSSAQPAAAERNSSYRLLQVWDSDADDHSVARRLLHGSCCRAAAAAAPPSLAAAAALLFPAAAAVSAGTPTAVSCVRVRVRVCVRVCVPLLLLLLVLPWRAGWLMIAGCRTQRHAPC